MPVSSWLQKYFDSRKSKKWDIKKKFSDLEGKIDPAFIASFESFHDKIMDIVEEDDSDMQGIICSELGDLDSKIEESNSRYTTLKAASLIEASN